MEKKFIGTLFLVVGNSGSGKDSIIYGVEEKYPKNLKKVRIVKRYITRPPDETEKNYSITPDQFKKMERKRKFALSWHIYQIDYGVSIEIDDWLKEGYPVLVNVSRTIINEAKEKYENIKVVFINVPYEISMERVKDRGREKGDLLNERLERAKTHQECEEADFVVNNSGKLEDAVDQLLSYVLKTIKKQ
ncbi:MAG TPA: phosphonate metabolism protein/1,5-bisphosphokinase (PRPP-forming) PhnN [Candidatus Lokiarchaeia archaeon]